VSRAVIDRRRIGRLLTQLANASVVEVLALTHADEAVQSDANRARRIGLTGPPGAGKSTLAGQLGVLRAALHTTGVLAIDPTSPRSGGAILGDRIRIDGLEQARDLFVRSLASRSAHDGLADNLDEMLAAMSHAGFEEIILETVGIGQSEHAVRTQVDTLVLVAVPEAGDVVQAMKAGIMELADIYVVNKADLPGARKMAAEILRIQHLAPTGRHGWEPPVLLTSSNDPASIQQLSHAIDRHQQWMLSDPERAARLAARARHRLRSLIERQLLETLGALPDDFYTQAIARQHDQIIECLRRG